MAEVRIKDIDEHEIDTILAEDIDFEGQLTFKKPLMIKGKFKGEITSTSALYIGEKAYVEAATEAAIVSSKGRHKGDILGHERVELFSTAHVDGNITTPDFVMESGCKFNGYCNMSGAAARETPSAAAAPAPVPAGTSPHQGGAAPAGGTPTAGGPAQHPQQQNPQPQHPQQQQHPQQGSGQRPGGPGPGGFDPSRGGGQR